MDDDVDWQVVKPEVFATIMDFFASGLPLVTEERPASDTGKEKYCSLGALLGTLNINVNFHIWSFLKTYIDNAVRS